MNTDSHHHPGSSRDYGKPCSSFAQIFRRRITMKMNAGRRSHRYRAMTLLEAMLAMTILTTISLLGAEALRTTWQSWDIQDRRSEQLQHLEGALSHITRHLRAARNIVEVPSPMDESAKWKVTLSDSTIAEWNHRDAGKKIDYKIDAVNYLLAANIDKLKMECYEIDGTTLTTNLSNIRMIRITATVIIPEVNTPYSLSTTVWLRKQQDELSADYVDFYANNSSTPVGWTNHGNLIGVPDSLLSYGEEGARVKGFGFDPTGYSGNIGTILVGLLIKTDGPLQGDQLTIQMENGAPGPLHSYKQSQLKRIENSLGWIWVDVTDDFGSWEYEDLSSTRVEFTNADVGLGETTVWLDAMKLRVFDTAPLTQSFWMSAEGGWNSEWRDRSDALGAPDASYAHSNLNFDNDVDRQAYLFNGSWKDLGTIVSVKLKMKNYYISTVFLNNFVHIRFPSTAEAQEPNDTPVPDTAQGISLFELNMHIGSSNLGSKEFDFTNVEDQWTWPGLNSRYARLYATIIGPFISGDIYLDAVEVIVRYVPPKNAELILWEEL